MFEKHVDSLTIKEFESRMPTRRVTTVEAFTRAATVGLNSQLGLFGEQPQAFFSKYLTSDNTDRLLRRGASSVC